MPVSKASLEHSSASSCTIGAMGLVKRPPRTSSNTSRYFIIGSGGTPRSAMTLQPSLKQGQPSRNQVSTKLGEGQSIITDSKSGSPDRARNTRAQTPAFDHRLSRWNTLFQAPKLSGSSRQCAPVRAIQSTASTNLRLSVAVRPGSLALPGHNSLLGFHGSSRNSRLAIPPPLGVERCRTTYHAVGE